jgi:hypothetical protein
MPEGPNNIEIAHELHERGVHEPSGGKSRFLKIVEIIEASLLALVAVSTAWSGYQAAKWDGRSAEEYATASKYRVEASQADTTGGQYLLYDATTFNSWLQAHAQGDEREAALFVRRFTPYYRVAFDAWLKTDPFHDKDAPFAPREMPQYHNPYLEQAAKLGDQASVAFDGGASARETGDDYVRTTVLLAMVLFITALSQRFDIRGVRIALMCVGAVFLVGALSFLISFPVA